MGICVILVYFFNTGCLLYPVQQTCISGIEWGIPKSEVSALNTHYQWWSKAGGGPGYSHEMEKGLYIQNFNWVSNWIEKYFIGKFFEQLQLLLENDKWVFFGCDGADHKLPESITKHKNCLIWNPRFIDNLLRDLPGPKWHKMISLGVKNKITDLYSIK